MHSALSYYNVNFITITITIVVVVVVVSTFFHNHEMAAHVTLKASSVIKFAKRYLHVSYRPNLYKGNFNFYNNVTKELKGPIPSI